MTERNDLIALTMNFSSYLISKIDVNRIILYGSIARGDFDEHSDIDIFIDADKKKERKIKKILDDFYKNENYKSWILKGHERDISLIVGNLNSFEWKDLKRAIITHGIILYGRYNAEIEKNNSYVLISFENLSPESKRVATHRKLFGFKMGKKSYPGFVEELNGKRIGKGSLIVPMENSQKIKDFLKKKKITYKIVDIWTDSKI